TSGWSHVCAEPIIVQGHYRANEAHSVGEEVSLESQRQIDDICTRCSDGPIVESRKLKSAVWSQRLCELRYGCFCGGGRKAGAPDQLWNKSQLRNDLARAPQTVPPTRPIHLTRIHIDSEDRMHIGVLTDRVGHAHKWIKRQVATALEVVRVAAGEAYN